MCEGKVACAVNDKASGNKMILDLSLTSMSSSLRRDTRKFLFAHRGFAGMAKSFGSGAWRHE
ncbi:MAG: hypothetical protein DME98_05560 [Verrucomicrobia bacterium]|nr:MAG: hypothetical protein DME98_05560 [Verrucomicrobiota bacterium]PYJ33929.1 MAG: hypothetical protein DME88_06875 [Verrucomicrobiota bacterium]